jgi:hypothetical protein
VGVGPPATIGPLGIGLAEGSSDGDGLADSGGADSEGPGTEALGVSAVAAGVLAVATGLELPGSDEVPGATTTGLGELPIAT